MNPLDMTGPEFLRFYLVYGLCGLALAGWLRILWNRGIAANGQLRWEPGYYPRDEEAYGIALLRGGRKEAVRTLIGRLLAGKFVAVEQGQVYKTEESPQDLSGLIPLERRVLESLYPRQIVEAAEVLVEESTGSSLSEMEQDLERQGLVPSKDARNRLLGLCGLALLAVPGLGVIKLMVAVNRGRFNVGYLLILLAVYTAAILTLLLPPRQTAAGRRYLSWLQDSHKGLRDLLASGRREDPGEAALAAGIFGTTMLLPALVAPTPAQQPKRKEATGDGGGGCGGGEAFATDFGSSDSGGGGDSGGGDGGGGDGGGSGCGGGGSCGGGGCGGCGGG